MQTQNTQRVIIGLSPGRTGSKSIAHILSKQIGASATHEHAPKLPYKKDLNLLKENISILQKKFIDKKYLCINGFFYTWYLDELMEMFPEAKVYVLTRDIEKTVDSHYRKVTKHCPGDKLMYKNYWNHQDRGRCKSDWELCFPNYGKGYALKQAIHKYVVEYWELIQKYVDKYTIKKIQRFNIEELNDNDYLYHFLRFLNIDEVDIRLPESKVQIVNRWFEIKEQRGGKNIKFKEV